MESYFDGERHGSLILVGMSTAALAGSGFLYRDHTGLTRGMS